MLHLYCKYNQIYQEFNFTTSNTNSYTTIEKFEISILSFLIQTLIMMQPIWNIDLLFYTDDIKGDVLVDVGSGPTIYQVMSGCERFNRVILSDFLEVNRRELQSWLQGGKSSLDWTTYFKYVCELEGRRWDFPIFLYFQKKKTTRKNKTSIKSNKTLKI